MAASASRAISAVGELVVVIAIRECGVVMRLVASVCVCLSVLFVLLLLKFCSTTATCSRNSHRLGE